MAAEIGHSDICSLLLNRGANIEAKDWVGEDDIIAVLMII
jgi:ankyrin repeat protein